MKFRRFCTVFLLLALLVTQLLPVTAYAVEDIQIEARAALLVDGATGTVLLDQDAHTKQYPASITKVMTALLVFEAIDRGELRMDTPITASANSVAGLPDDASTADIVAGETLTVEQLLYCLHVMVRYEIEKQLIAGTLTAKEVPAVWAELYKEYLGVEVPNDREGCLQDSHWSGGSFGYFPSYALGNAYGAQMLHNMEQEFDVYGGVAHGDLSAVTGWLREKVHQYGHLLEPAEVVRNACGTFDAHYYLDYLTKKYTELYNL